jgi:hypothetical protein
MAAETAAYLRLLVPALVGWVAWAVARAPYQERPNRLLASFLLVIAVEFLLESVWLLFPPVGSARWAQFLLGLADPPLLLAYALTFPRPPPRWRPWAYVAAWTAAAAVFTAALAAGNDADLNFTRPGWAAAHLVAVDGAYLAAFLVLLRHFLGEPRRFLARQLGFVALGAGFVGLSRTAAAFLPGGLQMPGTNLGLAARGALLVAAAYAILALVAWAWGRTARRSPAPLMATLGAVLAGFLGAWIALAAAAPGGFTFFFALRWVVFALIVGYGILRHQFFDFQAETGNTLAYLAAAVAAVAVSARVGQAAAGAEAARHAAALAAGAATLALGSLLLRQLGRLRPAPSEVASRRRLLEIYEATLEYAIEPATWSGPQRRLVETLRDLFEVTPEEHERIVARLRLP